MSWDIQRSEHSILLPHREFSRRYVVVSKAGHKPANEILSLYEGRRSNQLNLTDQFVQEQLKGISLGKNKQDAAVDALRAVRDSHPSLTIISKEEVLSLVSQ